MRDQARIIESILEAKDDWKNQLWNQRDFENIEV